MKRITLIFCFLLTISGCASKSLSPEEIAAYSDVKALIDAQVGLERQDVSYSEGNASLKRLTQGYLLAKQYCEVAGGILSQVKTYSKYAGVPLPTTYGMKQVRYAQQLIYNRFGDFTCILDGKDAWNVSFHFEKTEGDGIYNKAIVSTK
jgi:hypothetical protein